MRFEIGLIALGANLCNLKLILFVTVIYTRTPRHVDHSVGLRLN